MDPFSPADLVPVRLAAGRLHRHDARAGWGRPPAPRASDPAPCQDARAADRRELALRLAADRRASNA